MSGRHGGLVAARTVAAAVTVTVFTALLAAPAGADPVGDARARAAALAQTVAQLQTKAEVATERYDAVETKLGAAVTARLLAQRDLDAANTSSDADAAVTADHVRALYESGGPTTLLATVLDGSDLTDALARYHDVGMVLGVDQNRTSDAEARARHIADVEATLAATASTVTKLQAAAARAAVEVRAVLAVQQQALSDANAQVRQLAAAAARAAAAASAASFQQALLAAGGSLDGTTTPPNAIVVAAIAAARTKLGDPYLWGGTGPDAYDCSGLTQFAYGSAGIVLPRVAADQYNVGRHVALSELLPGDLLFWATDTGDPTTIHHVAMYLGNGMMIAAPHTGDVVKIEPVYMDGYIGATRPWDNGN